MSEREAVDGRPVGGRAGNAPHNTLTAALVAARDDAPDRYADDPRKIASVAWSAWQSGRDVVDVWGDVEGGKA